MIRHSEIFEADKKIAALLGWSWDDKQIYNGDETWARVANGKDRLRDVIPHYHSDGNAMLWLIYEMEKRGYVWEISSLEARVPHYNCFLEMAGLPQEHGKGETIQEAVCKAVVAALESEADNG